MANPDRQSKPEIGRSEQSALNWSFDEVYRVLAVALLGEYNNSLLRLQSDSNGNLQTTEQLAGSNLPTKDSTYYGDGLTSGVAAVAQRYFDGSTYNRTPASKVLIDKTTTTNVIYIGKAPIGTATSAGAWQITKVDKTGSPVSVTYAAAGAFTATWSNRTSETYT